MYYSKYIPPRTDHTTTPGNEDRRGRYHLSSDFSPEEIHELRVSLANSLYMLKRKFRPRRRDKGQPNNPEAKQG